MNGSLPSNFLPDGWHICGYHNSDCTGWSTSLDDSAGAGHSIIYEDGNVQSIVSYQSAKSPDKLPTFAGLLACLLSYY